MAKLEQNQRAYAKFKEWYGYGGIGRAEILHEWEDFDTYYLVVFFHGTLDFLRIFPVDNKYEISKDSEKCVYRECDVKWIDGQKYYPLQDVKDIIDKIGL